MITACFLLLILIYIKTPSNLNNKKSNPENPISMVSSDKKYTHEVEVLPEKIESLQMIKKEKIIAPEKIIKDFSTNHSYPDITPSLHQNEIINFDDSTLYIDDDNHTFINKNKPKRKIYPFIYFYDFAVVDYRRYEDREKYIQKTTYVLTGLSANRESNTKPDDETQLIEKQVQVKYMDYIEESMYYFSKHKYKNALKRFDIILSHYKKDLNGLFYGALCNYNLGDFDAALENFKMIIKLNESPFQEEANWYCAKSFIQLNKNEMAKEILTNIIAENGFYTKEAIVTLTELSLEK